MTDVRLSADAAADVRDYRRWLVAEAGPEIAEPYIDALIAHIRSLADFPERGAPRPDLGPEARTLVFRRRIIIAYVVADAAVTILRVFPYGREVTAGTMHRRS